MNHQPQLIILIATYNERPNLPRLLESIWSHLNHVSILVVDDNSPDGTGVWAERCAETEDRLQVLIRPHKKGLGTATIAGLKRALAGEPDWIATMDADFSHDPQELARMWDRLEQGRSTDTDVLIGSRYWPGGKITNWSWSRRLSSRMVNWFARWVLRLKPKDNTSALRFYRASSLNQIDLAKIDCGGFVYLEQILIYLQRANCQISEYPITFRQREEGKSKVTIGELFRNLRDLLSLAFR